MGATVNVKLNKSYEMQHGPSDSVSSIGFSPSSYGSSLNDVQVLCSTLKDDDSTMFTRGCDKTEKLWPLMSGGQLIQDVVHDASIKEVALIEQLNYLVEPQLSGSVSCLSCSPKLNYSVATSWDNQIRCGKSQAKAAISHDQQGVDAGGHAGDSSLGLLDLVEPLTEQLLVAVYSFGQSSQQAEDAYSRGMEKLQQILVQSLHLSPWELLVWQIK
ncbi:uncharacterized protein A4U43_C03F4070 [Asparagus officinalis]|uniref:Uncharacterized protein n=1 Tax=Asparagus officinalis TaxID=4686 RepID=A0A5P1F7X3_ASPOF|nr:uncharacterized protein A4U43_C03F4070 [Asparagus officinalis]